MPWLWQPAGAVLGLAVRPKAIVPSEGEDNVVPNSKSAVTHEIDRTMRLFLTTFL